MSAPYGQSAKPGFSLIKGKEYENVASRIQRYVRDFPEHAITTRIVRCNEEQVIMRAEIHNESGRLIASGHAEEKWSSSQINGTSALENGETSAIGRALATRGYGGTEFASADEVANAIHQQKAATQPQRQPKPESAAKKRLPNPSPEPIEFDRKGIRTTPIGSEELASTQDREDFARYLSGLRLLRPGQALNFVLGKLASDGRLGERDRRDAREQLIAGSFQLAENYAAIAWVHWKDEVEGLLAASLNKELESLSKQGG